MSNLFVSIPVPTSNGSGAPVDVSAMGASKTISVAGPFVAAVTIEVTNELVPTQWAPLITFGVPDGIVRDVSAHWMRATVADYKSGAPACDVGGDDTGALFVSLDVPVGNGAGAAADVSALDLFKSITVGGPFRGNVQIEVSEDGTSNWSQMGFGFNNPGLQSQKITAHWMRVVRAGVPLIAPGLPIVDVGASQFGGVTPHAVLSQCFIFRPGSAFTGPVVFNDWDELYADLQAARAASNGSGCYSIEFDDTDAALAIPAGAYDMDMVSWTSVHGPQVGFSRNLYYVTITDGAVITKLHSIDGLSIKRGAGGTDPCIILDNNTLTLSGGAGLTGGTSASLCLAANGLGSSPINVLEGAYIGGGDEAQAAILVEAGAQLIVWLSGTIGNDSSSVQAYAFDDSFGGGAVTVNAMESSSRYDSNQLYMTTPATVFQNCPVWAFGGDPNGLVSCGIYSGFRIIDQNTGIMWRNIGGTTVWVQDVAVTAFSYTVLGTEPDLANIVVPLPYVRPDAAYNVQATMGTFTAILGIAVPVLGRTVNDFVLSLTAGATAGDTFDFVVAQ